MDVYRGVVIPRVPAFLAGRAERELFVLQLLRIRIRVRRRELDLVLARTEERARRLADAGRDAFGLAGREVEHVDLIERIARLALALEHETLAVGRPIAFAGAAPLYREPPDPRQKIALPIRGCRLRFLRLLLRDERRGEERGQQDRTEHFHGTP